VSPNDTVRRWRTPMIIAAVAAIAVAGTASADTLINGGDLAPGSVTRSKLQKNAIGAEQIAAGAVTSSELRSKAVKNVNIADNAVRTANIANGAVTRPKIATGAVTGAQILDGSITAADLGAGAALPKVVVRTTTATVPDGPASEIAIACGTGEAALSGGYSSVPPANANVLQNRPTPAADGARPTGWSVIVKNSTGSSTQISAYAICAQL
jgi:hypothetical protein